MSRCRRSASPSWTLPARCPPSTPGGCSPGKIASRGCRTRRKTSEQSQPSRLERATWSRRGRAWRMNPMPREMFQHYGLGMEADRLTQHAGVLERERTQELLGRYLPPPPAIVLDVGGGAGAYAFPLASLGYTVNLLHPLPLPVEPTLASSRHSPRPVAARARGAARAP